MGTTDSESLAEIEALYASQGAPGGTHADVVRELLPLARKWIEATAAPGEVDAALTADECRDRKTPYREVIARNLQAAAAWRKAHEPKPSESEVDILSQIVELETDRDKLASIATLALDRNRDLLIENEKLRAQVEKAEKILQSVIESSHEEAGRFGRCTLEQRIRAEKAEAQIVGLNAALERAALAATEPGSAHTNKPDMTLATFATEQRAYYAAWEKQQSAQLAKNARDAGEPEESAND